jgi:uncharacterized OsmC-like protein
MRISANVRNTGRDHRVTVSTGGVVQDLGIKAKATGLGSSINGGEFLMLALATCYCNDLYREAAQLGITIDSVEIEAQAEFDGVGLAAKDIDSLASIASIEELLRRTDAVAEVHNTVRAGVAVSLVPWNIT